MKAKTLFLIYGQNLSHFLNAKSTGQYILRLFTESEEVNIHEMTNEFHLPTKIFRKRYFIGPFPDTSEIKKISFEVAEFLEVEEVILLEREVYNQLLLSADSPAQLLPLLFEKGDMMRINPDSDDSSLWNKIFN